MRKTYGKLNSSSKKGITLVELVVAITMTAIFAVACVALINPIERMYQSTVKLTKAQLLADTVVDAIRKECDDVKHDDKTTVWIANLNEGADDDTQLLSTGPSDTLKKDKGNTLVFQRNLNYTEAIYSCVPISATNRENVKDPANPIAGNKTGHSVAALFAADSSNQNKGIVHFGYYQSKEDDRGVFPIRSYDYTNPVTASTYGNFTVKLEFSNLTLKNGEYPAYVNCVVSVYDGLYTDASVSLKGPVYSRSTVISFSANGSGKGSGGGYTPSPSTLKNVYVTVNWKDSNNAQGLRPAAGVKIILISKDGSVEPKSKVLGNVTGGNRQTFMFANVDSSKEYTIRQYKVTSNDPIDDYTTSATKDASGFVITNTISTRPDVWLISGADFKTLIGSDVTGVVFGSEAGLSSYTTGLTAQSVALPLHQESGTRLPDYKLYKNTSTHTVYVTSVDGRFVAHKNCAGMFKDCKNLQSITWTDSANEGRVVIDTQYTTTMKEMFLHCNSLTQLNLRGLMKSACTDAEKMFQGCTKITSIDLRDWNTSGVTTMNRIFCNFGSPSPENAVTIDLSSFSFEHCKIMSKMFHHDSKELAYSTVVYIEEIRFPQEKNLNTVTTFDAMCSYGDGIKAITNLSNMNCPNLTEAQNVFYGCTLLKTLDLSNFKMPKCTNTIANVGNNANKIIHMFYNCSSLTSLNLNGWDIRGIKTLQEVFAKDTKLQTITMNDCTIGSEIALPSTFSGFDQLETLEMRGFNWAAVTHLNATFKNCKKLASIDTTFGENALSKCTTTEATFYACYLLNGIDLSNVKLLKSTTTKEMFRDCKALTSISLSDFHPSNKTDCSLMFYGCSELSTININFTSENYNVCTSVANMFCGCQKLTSLNFSNVNLPVCTDTNSMFMNCKRLKTVSMAGFVTPSNKDAHSMFENCYSLEELYVGGWDTSQVTNMSKMFYNCSRKGEGLSPTAKTVVIDISSFDFNNVKNMKEMFMTKEQYDYISKVIFPVVSSDPEATASTSGNPVAPVVEDISFMFRHRNNITTIENFGGFTVTSAKLLDAQYMFSNCTVETLDISGIDLTGFTGSVYQMFENCSNLTTIYVKDENVDFSDENFSNHANMFNKSNRLRGQEGTKIASNPVDKSYARVDLPGRPGYFSVAPTT